MKRILVPTDFSEQAKNAFEIAIAIARKTGASIKLLHVVEMPYSSAYGTTTATSTATGGFISPLNDSLAMGQRQVYLQEMLEASKRQIRELKNSIVHDGVEVVEEVETDRVISYIKRTIKEDQVDLVVMGSKGASGFDEFLIGSNTEKVVRSAECPVLTVKKPQPDFNPKEIVLASDFKREVSTAMGKFKAFQNLFGARVHLVYINTPGAFESSGNLRQKLEETAKCNGLKDYTVNIYNDTVEEDGILHFARDIKADLIMMATHGRTGFAHLLSGSIAEDLVNHTSRPVLTFHLK
ncbi:universal stress protein [Pontibacter silvestris]|uniref:Universal stress protein n=1 Tax=Pontibacter silvestris TaxID=2305183 RepID=A0ABW4WXZ3_9BACT|nr:universal stress protein [Pontibacter silvestris]MCC9138361.1 universal stress protein [Pontibacter silvestris]